MTNWLLTGVILSNLLIWASCVYAGLRLRFIIADFFKPPGDNQPSPAGFILSNLSKQFAANIVEQAKVTLMGVNSGIARAEKAAKGEVVTGVLSLLAKKHPLLAALMTIPGIQKATHKYPEPAMAILSGFLPRDNGNSPQPTEQSSFDL